MYAKGPDCGVGLQQMPNQIIDLRVLLTMVLFGICLAVPETDAQNPLGLIVRGSSFEDAKKHMEAALQEHIERILREQLGRGAQRVA
jgi:hypothetical protein